jgi:hypothetical protein
VVVIRPGPARQVTGGGTARFLRRGPESFEIETAAGPGGALLAVQRTNLLFQAAIDSHPTPLFTANAYRIGVDVPEGRHRVRFWIDRGPLHRSLAMAVIGLLLVPGLAWWGRRAG